MLDNNRMSPWSQRTAREHGHGRTDLADSQDVRPIPPAAAVHIALLTGVAYVGGLWAYPQILSAFHAPVDIDLSYAMAHGTSLGLDAILARLPAVVVILIGMSQDRWGLRRFLRKERLTQLAAVAVATIVASVLLDALALYPFSWRWAGPRRIMPIQAIVVSRNILAIGLSLIVTVGLTPLIEEVIFRIGILQGVRRLGGSGRVATIMSATLFSLAHYGTVGDGRAVQLVVLFWLFVGGLVLGAVAVKRSGNVTMAVVIHGARNLIESVYLAMLIVLAR